MSTSGRIFRGFVPFVWALIVAMIVVLSIPAVADEGKDESGKGDEKQHEESGSEDKGKGNQGNEEGDGEEADKADEAGDGSSGGSTGDDSDGGTRDRRASETSRESTSSGGGGGSSSTASQEQSSGQGNIPCTDVLGAGALELKLQNPGNGTYSDGTLSVTISRAGEGTISWTSNIDVDAVIMKGGSTSNIYRLPGSNDLSGSASTPLNPANNQLYGLSHVSFCYLPDAGTPPPGPCVDNPDTPVDECNPPPPCVDDMNTPVDECNPPPPCVDDMNTPVDECNPPVPCVDDMSTPTDECNPPPEGPPDDDVLGDILSNHPEDEVGAEAEDAEADARASGAAELPATGASVFELIVLGMTLIGTGAGTVVTRRRRT